MVLGVGFGVQELGSRVPDMLCRVWGLLLHVVLSVSCVGYRV